MIELSNVTKEYVEGNKALRNVNITIEDGEFVFIMGRNGSGKTTIFKLLMKEEELTSGRIVVNDMNLGKMPRSYVPKYRRRLGVVFQDFRLLKDRNVYENVAFAQRVVGASSKRIRESVPAMLQMVGLSSKYKMYPHQLSGGEQQRVAIARALINRPEVLLADEPTGNLDSHNAMEIMKLLEDINEMGTTVIVVTHSHEIVEQMHKRVIRMERGCVVSDQMEFGGVYAGSGHYEEHYADRERRAAGGYAGEGRYEDGDGYTGGEQYEGEGGYAGDGQYESGYGDGRYAGESSYAGEGQYAGEDGHAGDGRYEDESGYASDGRYENGDGYTGGEQYEGEGGYAGEGQYASGYGDSRYAGESSYAGEGQYDGEGNYAGGGQYAGEGDHAGDGQYEDASGYGGEQYADGQGYADDGAQYADAGGQGGEDRYEDAAGAEADAYPEERPHEGTN